MRNCYRKVSRKRHLSSLESTELNRSGQTAGARLPTSYARAERPLLPRCGVAAHNEARRWPVVDLNVGGARFGRAVALRLNGRASRPLLSVELGVAARAFVASRRVADRRGAAADLVGVGRNERSGSR